MDLTIPFLVDFPSVFWASKIRLESQHKNSKISFAYHYIAQYGFLMGSIDPWWTSGSLVIVSRAHSWFYREPKFFVNLGPFPVTFPSVKTQSGRPKIFFHKFGPKSLEIDFFLWISSQNLILNSSGWCGMLQVHLFKQTTKCLFFAQKRARAVVEIKTPPRPLK